MQFQGWKSFLVTVLLVIIGASSYTIKVNASSGKKTDISMCQDELEKIQEFLLDAENINNSCQKGYLDTNHAQLPQFNVFEISSEEQVDLNLVNPRLSITQAIPTQTENPEPNSIPRADTDVIQQRNESPQLETQPNNFPQTSPKPIEQLLESPPKNDNERLDRLERLRRRLREAKQSNSESEIYQELGLRVRQRPLPNPPLEQQQPPPIERPAPKFKPIGSLQARLGYFHTSNIFSSETIPVEDGLLFYGIRLTSAYFPLGSKTYLNGSIDGNLIRYVDQSKFNYNQLRFNLGIYQQLSRRMFGEISWSNQQLFYANSSDIFKSGDRFLSEQSFRLSLGRRDPLTKKLMLDSFYELSWNLADPDSRSRIVNSLWLSLNYEVQKPLDVGLNYQLNLSDFTERDRHDQSHRLFAHLTYRLSKSSKMNVQTGFSFGDSTTRNIDFDSWFLSVNYNWLLGEF
ncbi:hypothetical protein H6G36_10470 [Anabaena minutissima FACHB-250]|nr:hypothetical protein [Anabaena minutissima FACHB-250]